MRYGMVVLYHSCVPRLRFDDRKFQIPSRESDFPFAGTKFYSDPRRPVIAASHAWHRHTHNNAPWHHSKPTMASFAALRMTATRARVMARSYLAKNTQRRNMALGGVSKPAEEWEGIDRVVRTYLPHDYQSTFT